jgi:hypothetical protein
VAADAVHRSSAGIGPEVITLHPGVTMNAPTPHEFRAATTVLNRLSHRIDNDAAERVIRLPESRYGDQHATRIEAQTMEQTSRIAAVIAQLEGWREELQQQRRHRVTHRV